MTTGGIPKKEEIYQSILRRVREIQRADLPCFEERHAQKLGEAVALYVAADIEGLEPGEEPNWYVGYLSEDFVNDLWILAECTESPIETLLGAWLLLASDGDNCLSFHDAWQAHPDPEFGTIFGCQVEVANYRCDFLVKTCLRGDYELLAIECDGHEFHEKTKKQARRDKSRDRFLLSGGIPVLRFTGSELWRDPHACVLQVEKQLRNHVSALLAKHGIEKPRRKQDWVRGAVEPIRFEKSWSD